MEDGESKYYHIGELANLISLSPRTIRYNEEIGLLNSVKRIEGGKGSIPIRTYSALNSSNGLNTSAFPL